MLFRSQMFRRLTIIFWANVVVCIGLIVLYILIHFPQSIVVYPVKKVYAIGDMSTDYYEVVVNPVIGKSYVLDNPNIDVKLDVDDYYEVTAHYFGLTDTVKVKPIAQSNVVVEYADKVGKSSAAWYLYISSYLILFQFQFSFTVNLTYAP